MYLESLLNDINQKTKNDLENEHITQITTRELGDLTKGVWLLRLAKKTKTKENPKPFDFQFEQTEIHWKPIRLAKIICKSKISNQITEKSTKNEEQILIENS